MKKWSIKKTVIIILAALVFFVPIRLGYKDGGSVEYRAILYSVTKRHAMTVQNGQDGFWVGTEVKILFFEIYNDVEFMADVE